MPLTDHSILTEIITQIAAGTETCLFAGNLSDAITIAAEETTKRDFIRQIFFDNGIEIEFSGKNEHEKGVVIDIDEDKINLLGFNQNTLRFGQTVVKAITK